MALHGQKPLLLSAHAHLETDTEALLPEAIGGMTLAAEFVVLNACHSGEGRIIGLFSNESPARSLMMAGASAVVSNVWAVDDLASSDVFREFYRFWFAGASSTEALASAKRNFILTRSSSRAAHPYYWAAHMHCGQSAAIIQSTGNADSSIISTGIGVLIAFFTVALAYFYARRKRVPKASPR
jgi:CHAT domain-containing protein